MPRPNQNVKPTPEKILQLGNEPLTPAEELIGGLMTNPALLQVADLNEGDVSREHADMLWCVKAGAIDDALQANDDDPDFVKWQKDLRRLHGFRRSITPERARELAQHITRPAVGPRRDPEIDRALAKLTADLKAAQAADDNDAKSQAINDCAKALEPFGFGHNETIHALFRAVLQKCFGDGPSINGRADGVPEENTIAPENESVTAPATQACDASAEERGDVRDKTTHARWYDQLFLDAGARNINSADVHVGWAIGRRVGKTGTCFPGYAALAKATALSVRNIQRSIIRLERQGHIRTANIQTANGRYIRFTLLLKPPDKLAGGGPDKLAGGVRTQMTGVPDSNDRGTGLPERGPPIGSRAYRANLKREPGKRTLKEEEESIPAIDDDGSTTPEAVKEASKKAAAEREQGEGSCHGSFSASRGEAAPEEIASQFEGWWVHYPLKRAATHSSRRASAI